MKTRTGPVEELQTILSDYGLDGAHIERIDVGLINSTWRVTRDHVHHVLQRVNPMFPAAIHDDIEAVTAHIAARGLLTPRLVRSRSGALCVEREGALWRLWTYVEGVTRNTINDTADAAGAGALLAHFHCALADFEQPLENARLGVHDTARHLRHLEDTLGARREHARFDAVAPLARHILDTARSLPALPVLPDRVVHGDPKINNIIFARDSHEARCLVDLDCVARMPLPLELGDAFRSWCNPAGEDTRDTQFSAEIFLSAARTYAAVVSGMITRLESQSIVPATLTIYVELAARFCADALNEDYFGWDPARFPSHSEHSEVRAAGQLNAALDLRKQEPDLAAALEPLFR